MIFRINSETWDTKEIPERQICAEMYFYYRPEDIVIVSENSIVLEKLRLDELFTKPYDKKV
jgi:hypothetical protein